MPDRLSYPEILGLKQNENAKNFFYNGSVKDLAEKLELLSEKLQKNELWSNIPTSNQLTEKLKWHNLAQKYDKAFEESRLKSN